MTTPTASVPTTSPEWEETQTEFLTFANEENITEIRNDEQNFVAGAQVVIIAKMRKDLDAERKKITVPLDTAKKAAMAQWKAVDTPLATVDTHIRGLMSVYATEQRRKAEEAQAELDRIARESAEHERLAEAERLEKEGRKEEAEAAIAPAAIERAVQQRQTYVSTTPAKVDGVSMRKQPHIKIEDPKKIPREYLMPDEAKIKGVVKALKFQHGIPGVKYWETDEPVVRS